MATYNLITDPIKLNEFRFYRETPANNPLYATKPFDGWKLSETILPWMLKNTFVHKKLFIDTCTVYFNTQANFVGTALPYPDLEVLDVNMNVVADLSLLPFIKGAQQVSGNTIYNPQTDTDEQANSYCWQFRFQDIVTTDNTGIYYLRLTNTASDGVTNVRYLTEPIFVYGSDAATYFPNTVLITCYNNSNNNYMGYLKGGWTDPSFYPTFRHRIEGYLTEFEPKGVFIGMLEQEYQPHKILAQNYRSFKFELGGTASQGVPAFMHEKINEVFSTDVFTIDGKRYERDVTDTDAGIKSLWQAQKPQTADRRWASTILREDKNWRYIFFDQVENPCSCPLLTEAFVSQSGPSYFGNLKFDFTGGFICPFKVEVTTAFSFGVFYIYSLADFTSNVGSIYLLNFIIGGYPDMSYAVKKLDDTICYEGEITIDCDGPEVGAITMTESLTPGEFTILVEFPACGDDCQDITFNYTQMLPTSATPDSGSEPIIVSCPSSNETFDVTPADYTEGDAVKYKLTWVDCCGNTGEREVIFAPPVEIVDSPSYPFALSPFSIDNGTDTVAIRQVKIEDSTDLDNYVTYMNSTFLPSTALGGVYSRVGDTVYYVPGTGEIASIVGTITVYNDYMTLDFLSDAILGSTSGYAYAGVGSRQIIDWGDVAPGVYNTFELIDQFSGGIYGSTHTYGTGSTSYTARIFHNNLITQLALNEAGTYYPVPSGEVTAIGGDLPTSLSQFVIQACAEIASLNSDVLDIDLSMCVNLTGLQVVNCAHVTDFATMFDNSLPLLSFVGLTGNPLAVSAVDDLFNDFVANVWNGVLASGTINTVSSPAAVPTGTSSTARADLNAASWTVTIDT